MKRNDVEQACSTQNCNRHSVVLTHVVAYKVSGRAVGSRTSPQIASMTCIAARHLPPARWTQVLPAELR